MSMDYIALLTHWHYFMSSCTLLTQSSAPCISPFSLPLTDWPGHECRNGSHHMVLSECRGVFEEGRGDDQTVWDIHQTGALHKIMSHSYTHNLETRPVHYFYSPHLPSHQICDLYECRIRANLDQMSHTLLLHLPTTETWTTDQFLMEAKVRRVNITVCDGRQFTVVCTSEPFLSPSVLQWCRDAGVAWM